MGISSTLALLSFLSFYQFLLDDDFDRRQRKSTSAKQKFWKKKKIALRLKDFLLFHLQLNLFII